MKRLFYAAIALSIISCSYLRTNNTPAGNITWTEKPIRSVSKIDFGIPSFNKITVRYKRNGKNEFTVSMTEPTVIVTADKPEGWGYYQFPTISPLKDGSLHAEWSLHPDAIQSYGLNAVGSAISKNKGKTWVYATPDSSLIKGYEMPNGDMVKVKDPVPIPVTQLNMPRALGMTNFKYRKTNFTFYKMSDMPAERNGAFLLRRSRGSDAWKLERASIDDPKGVRYSSKDLVPVVWWGDMHTMKDGSVVAGMYPGYYITENGEVDKQMGVVFYRSTDQGHSWKIQGRIPFQPDLRLDSMGKDRIGFSEPAYDVLEDGTLLCVIRSADGDGVTNGVGNGPLYASRSNDLGVSWSKPEVIAPAGALPRLLRLQNGVIVLTSGRPGVQIRFSKTGANDSWTDPFEMLPWENKSMEVLYLVSCGYTGLLATGPNKFLVIYSDFRHRNASNEERKAIKVREVMVEKG